MRNFDTKIHNIIIENVKKVLNEVDLSQGDNVSSYRSAITAWKMLYTAMDEIKRSMDYTADNKGGVQNLGMNDVQRILEHIYTTIDNCLSSTLPQLRKRI